MFRAGAHMLVVMGVFCALFMALAIGSGAKNGDWKPTAVVAAVSVAWFALQSVLRLEIGPVGLSYRNLSGSWSVEYERIQRASIEVVRPRSAPQGVATFWLQLRDGKRRKINLRTFSIEAAGALFAALESHQVQVETSDEWAARRLADQVRAARTRTTK